MAWLQNLAGRAEDLLNKIDQNAATVLNESRSLEEGNTKKSDDLPDDSVPEVSVSTGPPESFSSLKLSSNNSQISYIETPKTSPESFSFLKLSSNNSQISYIETPKTSLEEENQQSSDNQEYAEETEKSSKSGTPSSKSLSSHNSFILTEDIQSYRETIAKLENEIREQCKQLLNLQHLDAELSNENSNLQSQVEASNYLVTTAQSEMEQYKARAQRILQEKESLILLKNESKSSENSDQILSNYNDELKREVEFQVNRNVDLTEKVKTSTQEISLLQQQIVLIQNSTQQANQILQENLATEKRVKMIAEEDCRFKTQELQVKIQELSQQYQVVQAKNEEIKNLQEALKSKSSNSANIDFETRIKSLTDTLMLKQNSLETVTTERNALRIQLEKLESEYHNNLVQLERAQVRVINMNDTDDENVSVKSQVPHFMRVSPFDAGVTRRVKHAYSTVDAISVRTGIFLRRYPVARVFVFCYMVLLHFWALILLFLYAPSNR